MCSDIQQCHAYSHTSVLNHRIVLLRIGLSGYTCSTRPGVKSYTIARHVTGRCICSHSVYANCRLASEGRHSWSMEESTRLHCSILFRTGTILDSLVLCITSSKNLHSSLQKDFQYDVIMQTSPYTHSLSYLRQLSITGHSHGLIPSPVPSLGVVFIDTASSLH